MIFKYINGCVIVGTEGRLMPRDIEVVGLIRTGRALNFFTLSCSIFLSLISCFPPSVEYPKSGPS